MNIDSIKTKWSLIFIFIVCSIFTFNVMAEEQEEYQFNTGFLMGSKDSLDLSRFNKMGIDEGKYSVDVYTNNNWKGRYDLNLVKQNNGKLGVCYTPDMLADFGISAEALNKNYSKDSSSCFPLEQWNKDKNIQENFNPSLLKLMISMPQIYEESGSKGLIPSKFWDKGVAAMNLSYMSNYYDNHISSNGVNDTQSAYLGLNAGFSFDGWLLKHIGNLTWQNNSKTKWDSNQTYLQRAIPSIKSTMVLGQFYTEGNLFDSLKLKGVKLSTSDNMYADGVTSYAPEIKGVAMSNALVTVRQNGNIIYQTSVAPGPFSLNDVYASGYGSDLDVTVKEADGSETNFSVPYSSIAQLLRPGFTHYQIAAGKADNGYIKNTPNIIQGTIQHGLNNTFTLYSGVTAFDDYQAYQLGTGISTSFGAFAIDVTQANTTFKNSKESGRNYRLSFNKQFEQTNTNLLISTSRSGSEHYYSTNEVLNFIDYEKRGLTSNRSPQKSDLSLTVNQQLPDGYGSFYLTGRATNYWGESTMRKQLQQTYNNRIGNLSYSLSYMRVYSNYNDKNKTDNRFTVNLTYPLDFMGKKSTVSSSTIFNNSNFGSSQLGMNGTLDDDNRLTYGINAATSRGESKNIALNSSYRSSISSLNANYSQGEKYRQFGVGANGSVILHQGGATFTPNTSNTMVLVEAKGAKGATIPGSPGTEIDSNGYAIASYARPYRVNTVEINPKGTADDIVFSNTSSQVVPYEGSVTKIKFETKVEKNNVFNVVRSDGKPLIFGTDITNEKGESIGVVGQGGQVFINNEEDSKAIVKWANGQCSFSLKDTNENDKVCI